MKIIKLRNKPYDWIEDSSEEEFFQRALEEAEFWKRRREIASRYVWEERKRKIADILSYLTWVAIAALAGIWVGTLIKLL